MNTSASITIANRRSGIHIRSIGRTRANRARAIIRRSERVAKHIDGPLVLLKDHLAERQGTEIGDAHDIAVSANGLGPVILATGVFIVKVLIGIFRDVDVRDKRGADDAILRRSAIAASIRGPAEALAVTASGKVTLAIAATLALSQVPSYSDT